MRKLLIVAVLGSVLLVSACSSSNGDQNQNQNMDHSKMNNMDHSKMNMNQSNQNSNENTTNIGK